MLKNDLRKLKWMLWNSAKLSKTIAENSNSSLQKSWWNAVKFTYQNGISPDHYLWWKVWNFNEQERKEKLPQMVIDARKSKQWEDDYSDNRAFLDKYNKFKWETSISKRWKRSSAYRKRYNAGEGLYVQHNVDISREHGLDGEISIGRNVVLAKNVFIDYSGGVAIGDDVAISNGTIIESHSHKIYSDVNSCREIAQKEPINIHKGVIIGSRAIICESCGEIGRYAIIGAGAVVRSKVPPYAVVIGNPAKIIGYRNTVDEIIKFENEQFTTDDRIPVRIIEKNFNRYFNNRERIAEYLSIR